MQETVQGADVLVFCTPHQFTRDICRQLRGKVKTDAIAISLTKVVAKLLMVPQGIVQAIMLVSPAETCTFEITRCPQ